MSTEFTNLAAATEIARTLRTDSVRITGDRNRGNK